MNERYDIKKWEEAGTKNIFIWKFFLDRNAIPGWEISEKNIRTDIKYIDCIEYYWENRNSKDEAIKIDIYEYPSWKAAQQNLLNMLENHMAMELPEVSAEKFRLGDMAYSGSGRIQQHIQFVRGNMLAVLNSIGNKDIPVTEIAKIVDEQFYSRAVSSEKDIAPVIEKFSLFRQQNNKGSEIIGIEILGADPLHRPVWYKFFANQGEFFRENEHISFISPTDQKDQIIVLVTNENGISVERMINLDTSGLP